MERAGLQNEINSNPSIMQEIKTIWTIGHSTHTFEEFLAWLNAFHIEFIADIRAYPGSRKFPQFNKDTLAMSLGQNNIQYFHLGGLGGRKKPDPLSNNTAWRHAAFRGYADYMETSLFREAMQTLTEFALKKRTAFMCSEAVWWRCHRSLVADHLKHNGWAVMHIMGNGKATEHPYTAPARIIDGQLSYKSPE